MCVFNPFFILRTGSLYPASEQAAWQQHFVTLEARRTPVGFGV